MLMVFPFTSMGLFFIDSFPSLWPLNIGVTLSSVLGLHLSSTFTLSLTQCFSFKHHWHIKESKIFPPALTYVLESYKQLQLSFGIFTWLPTTHLKLNSVLSHSPLALPFSTPTTVLTLGKWHHHLPHCLSFISRVYSLFLLE